MMAMPMDESEAIEALRADASRAAAAAELLWAMWHRSGKPEIDGLLHDGIVAMQQQEYTAAEQTFSQIIALVPDFAEGWNKRATVRYMAQNYEGAIADCEETLKRNPNHFGALSGQGLCHMALGQFREATTLFRRTLEVHPHLASARQNLRSALNEVVKWN
jgi:tetratricopeptide (TPR) repeat protein